MLDDDFVFEVKTYGPEGDLVAHTVEAIPISNPEEVLFAAGASRTGAKSVPDNTDSLGLIFRMKVESDAPPKRRFLPVYECSWPWRKGWGFGRFDGLHVRIYGVWVPWPHPRQPKVEVFTDHTARHESPAELLGPNLPGPSE